MIKEIPGFSNYKINRKGRVWNIKTGKIRKPFLNPHTGRLVQNNLVWDNGSNKCMQISRLVAITYIPNPNNHPCVLHKDDNKLNNHYRNLYWGTHEMNMQDKVKNGWKGQLGDVNGMTKYGVEFCSRVFRLKQSGKSVKYISESLNIPLRRVYFIINGSSTHSRTAQHLQLS